MKSLLTPWGPIRYRAEPSGGLQGVLPTNSRIVRQWHYNRANNALVELSVLPQNIAEFMFFAGPRTNCPRWWLRDARATSGSTILTI